MNKYSSELFQKSVLGHCLGAVRKSFSSILIYCTSHPEVSLLLHEWSNFGSLEGFYEDLGTQLFNLWLEIVKFFSLYH
jgi:hypothetical protein